MGQQHRRTPRRPFAALLFTGLAALTVAVLPADGPAPATRPAVAVRPLAPDSASVTAAPEPAAPEPDTPEPAASEPAAVPESATVGALFTGAVAPGNHFCTASVLHSATGNLLLTAAHCLDRADGITFVPGYRDGTAPYGTWQVTRVHTTMGWFEDGDEDEDFAVLETAPSGGRTVESVVGGNRLGTDEPFGTAVRLYGYPASTETVRLCTNTTGRHGDQQRVIGCAGYPGGTSGGPWISTATGHVIGAIGGYQQGGDHPDTSYSALFDATIADLYEEAVAAAS